MSRPVRCTSWHDIVIRSWRNLLITLGNAYVDNIIKDIQQEEITHGISNEATCCILEENKNAEDKTVDELLKTIVINKNHITDNQLKGLS